MGTILRFELVSITADVTVTSQNIFFIKETLQIPGLRLYRLERLTMRHQQSIYRISYSVYDEAIRPLPRFYFYAWASNAHESLEKFNNYAEERDISCRCVAAGYILEEGELPAAVDRDSLEVGIAIERKALLPVVDQPIADQPIADQPLLERPAPAAAA